MKIYLAGGIQHAKTPNSWRTILLNIFKDLNINGLNPVEDNEYIFSDSIMGYKNDGTVNTQQDLLRTDEKKLALLYKQTEDNDLYFIDKSDIILFYYDSKAGFGTSSEFKYAYDIHKPIILIRLISRIALPHWLYWRRLYGIESKQIIEFLNLHDVKLWFKKKLYKEFVYERKN